MGLTKASLLRKLINKTLLSTLLVSMMLTLSPHQVMSSPLSLPTVNAEGYILGDMRTGRILASHNETTPMIPASLTKIMTLFVVFDEIDAGRLSLEDKVPISEAAWATGGSKMFVMVGTEATLEDLVKGITVMSGNDACVAVAEFVSGNVTTFVDRMNRKASELGLTTARFVDPHGLSDENRISPADFLTLVRAYVRTHPSALPYHAMKEFAYTAPGDQEKAPQFNRNRLLWSYPGTYGLKTGFTTKAGFNMAALCERSGMDVGLVVMGSAKGKSIEQGEQERANLVISLLDWAYRNFSYVKVADPGTNMGEARVWKGKGKWIEAIAIDGLGATVEKGQEDLVTHSVELRQDLEAPISKGSKVGEVVFTVDGQEVGRSVLVAKDDVPKGNFLRVIWDTVARALLRAFGKAS
jgi:D-alanyl-D-alanine carboxypeptidase (penicillin-binding protein 5/6)